MNDTEKKQVRFLIEALDAATGLGDDPNKINKYMAIISISFLLAGFTIFHLFSLAFAFVISFFVTMSGGLFETAFIVGIIVYGVYILWGLIMNNTANANKENKDGES